MILLSNYKTVLTKSWSLWAVYLLGILQIAQQATPYMGDVLPWWLPLAITLAIPLLRVVSQGLSDPGAQ